MVCDLLWLADVEDCAEALLSVALCGWLDVAIAAAPRLGKRCLLLALAREAATACIAAPSTDFPMSFGRLMKVGRLARGLDDPIPLAELPLCASPGRALEDLLVRSED